MAFLNQATITIGASFPNLKLESAKKTFHLSDYLEQQNVVLQFVCHFSCSRCWRTVMRLEQLYTALQRFDITVLVVGRGEHLCPASQLAYELNIPFLLLRTVTHPIQLISNGEDIHADPHYNATVLLDNQGVVRYGQFTHSTTATLDENALMAAVACLGTQPVNSGAGQKIAGFQQPFAASAKGQGNATFHLSLPESCSC